MFKGQIRSVTNDDIDMVFEWRNRDQIRKNMYNSEIIEYDTHKKWFESILTSNNSQYFIYEQEKAPLGLVSFTNIDYENKHASWAFYSSDFSVRGVGSEMEKLALQHAFNNLGLNKLCCEVLDFNFPVVRFHQKHGFKIEGIKKQQYKRDNEYFDIYQLAIFKKDYEKILKSDFKSKIAKSYKWNFIIEGSMVDKFADISGDRNPIHLDNEIAKKMGFEGRIAHGAILVAEISRVAASEYPGPNTIYLSQDISYSAPVYPEMEITGKATLTTEIGRYCLIKFELSNNDQILATSYSEFLLGK
jgi:UDP-4-amino-4,6-dideoxy-N-acetyl-beta-L-altrosamine N-acetyltransferase